MSMFGSNNDWNSYSNALGNVGKGIGDFLNQVIRAYGQQSNPYGQGVRSQVKTTPKTGNSSVLDAYQYNLKTGQPVNKKAGLPVPVKQPRIKTGGTASVGGGGNPIAAMFAPLFANLRQQKAQANKRYEANRQQVTNIYGQIVGARTEDIPATEEAFKRLVEAAATRSEAVNTSIDTAEAERLQGNRAALQSMGLSDLSVPEGDFASESAAMAKQTNELNAANWGDMLGTMSATSQDIARSDISSYNYSMMEDIAALQANRENFLADLGQQEAQLLAQKAQATFEYQQAQQAAAAAAASARQRAKSSKAAAKERQMASALANSGPVNKIVANRVKLNQLTTGEAARVTNSINEWFTNVPPPASGRWNAGAAKASLLSIAKGKLNAREQSAIVAIFDSMKW